MKNNVTLCSKIVHTQLPNNLFLGLYPKGILKTGEPRNKGKNVHGSTVGESKELGSTQISVNNKMVQIIVVNLHIEMLESSNNK